MIEFQNVGQLDYYTTPEFAGGEARIEWHGKGRELLGLPEQFDPVMFDRLLNGLNPHDGSRLAARLQKGRRRGTDVTITDEKVSSLLEMVAGDERVGLLRQEANDKAMERLERLASVQVRKGGAVSKRHTGVALWATVEHATNRDGMIHRHHHNVMVNLTYDKKEGMWKALEVPRSKIQAVERAHTKQIVDGLRGLGYKVKAMGKRYHLPDIDQAVIDRLSTGRQRVQVTKGAMEGKTQKPMSPKAAAKLALYDRPPKESGTRQEMTRSWVERLDDLEQFKLERSVQAAKGKARAREWAVQARASFERERDIEVEREYGRERER